MLGLEYYLVLVSATTLIVILTYLTWVRVKSPVFAMGSFLIYYWTLFGAWTLVKDLSQGRTQTQYQYLFGKMFHVELDGHYFSALIYYTAFVLVALFVVYWIVPRRENHRGTGHAFKAVMVSHNRLAIAALVSLFLSFWLVKGQLLEAMFMNMSGYNVTATSEDKNLLFLMHQMLNSLAVIPAALGVATFASGPEGQFLQGKRTPFGVLLYVVTTVCLFGFGILMGNKNELFGGVIMGIAFFLINSPRPRIFAMGAWGSVALAGIAVIDFARSLSILDLVSDFSWQKAGESVISILNSNEAFASHFSMYGAIHYDVGKTWGTSVLSLMASFVPRVFWPDRPETIYQYYVDGVGALPGQGYTIHHATGWYLNFGVVGVVLGAIVLGLIWAGLFRGAFSGTDERRRWRRILFAIGFSAFTGGLPVLLRNGLEVYKPILLFSLVMPMIVIWASSVGVDGLQIRNVSDDH